MESINELRELENENNSIQSITSNILLKITKQEKDIQAAENEIYLAKQKFQNELDGIKLQKNKILEDIKTKEENKNDLNTLLTG